MEAENLAVKQLLERSANDEFGLQIAIVTIGKIVDNAAETLYNHYLDTRIPAIVSTDTVHEISYLLQERFKHQILADTDLNPIWLPESEPIPPPIDVQATGVVKVVRRSTHVGYPEFKASEPTDGRESTVSSSRRSSSKRSVARFMSSKPDEPVQSSVPKLVESTEPRRILADVEERERFRELHMKRLVCPQVAVTSGTTTVTRIETDPETEQFNKILEAAAGRPYTYDSHGVPVVISALKPERLPPFLASTEVVLPSDTPVPEPVPEKIKPKPKREKKTNAAFVKPAADAQPTIAQSIVMAPGVTFKEGFIVKSGEKRQAPLSVENMTLAQYRAYLEQESPSLTAMKTPEPAPGATVTSLPEIRPKSSIRPASPSARFNEQLIKDPNWGANPDTHHSMRPNSIRSVARPAPNRSQTRTPRTRPFIETMIPKRHLAHPVFPLSKGHEGRVPRLSDQKSSIEKVRRAAREEVQYPRRIENRGQRPAKIYTTPLAKRLFGGEAANGSSIGNVI